MQVKPLASVDFPYREPKILWKCNYVPQSFPKQPTPPSESRGIICKKIVCECSSIYVGHTSRTLLDRIKEHISDWLRNG